MEVPSKFQKDVSDTHSSKTKAQILNDIEKRNSFYIFYL